MSESCDNSLFDINPVWSGSPISDNDIDYLAEAERAYDAFQSVDVSPQHLLILDDQTKRRRTERLHGDIRPRLLDFLDEAESEKRSLILTLTGEPATYQGYRNCRPILQIENASAEIADRLAPYCFAIFHLASRNYSCWLALENTVDETDAQCFERTTAIRQAIYSSLGYEPDNDHSWGSLRWPGSRNYKTQYRRKSDGLGPFVRAVSVNEGRRVTVSELRAAGLISKGSE